MYNSVGLFIKEFSALTRPANCYEKIIVATIWPYKLQCCENRL